MNGIAASTQFVENSKGFTRNKSGHYNVRIQLFLIAIIRCSHKELMFTTVCDQAQFWPGTKQTTTAGKLSRPYKQS